MSKRTDIQDTHILRNGWEEQGGCSRKRTRLSLGASYNGFMWCYDWVSPTWLQLVFGSWLWPCACHVIFNQKLTAQNLTMTQQRLDKCCTNNPITLLDCAKSYNGLDVSNYFINVYRVYVWSPDWPGYISIFSSDISIPCRHVNDHVHRWFYVLSITSTLHTAHPHCIPCL